MDVEILIESYAILKQYIPVKDQQEAADNLMSSMIDLLSDEDLRYFAASDNVLTRSLEEFVGNDQEEENED
jgi:hypothetical protein